MVNFGIHQNPHHTAITFPRTIQTIQQIRSQTKQDNFTMMLPLQEPVAPISTVIWPARRNNARAIQEQEQVQEQEQSSRLAVAVRNHIFHYHRSFLVPFCNMAETMDRIDIPNRDPQEWRLVASILRPSNFIRGKPCITEHNVDMLLPWFHDLQATSLIKQCDWVYSQMINISNANSRNYNQVQQSFHLSHCLAIMEKAQQYCLHDALESGLHCLVQCVRNQPEVLACPEFCNAIRPFLYFDPLWKECVSRIGPPQRSMEDDDEDLYGY